MANTALTLANAAVPWLSTSFDVAPYFDDTDESKNYERVLFKPTVAVQTRELNQLQTYIQKQNARISSSIFQEGSRVKGGAFNIDLTATYLRVKDTDTFSNPVVISNYVGQIITGVTSGVKAQVIVAVDGSEGFPPNTKTFIIKYTSVSTDNTTNAFIVGEQLTSANGFRATIINDSAAIGNASYMKIDPGVFFLKGFPVRTDAATVVLDKNSNSPTCRVGITVAENIITYLDDPTLVSNATGAPNYAAPGADRLQLETALTVFKLTDTLPDNYVELVVVIGGVIQSATTRTQYSDIMDELARRTYQQSGDFVINGMTLQVREHLDNSFNNGYLTANNGGNTQQLVIGITPGEAYVKGYDVQYLVTQYTPVDKGIDYKNVDNVALQANFGNYAIATQFAGSFDITDGDQVSLYDTAQARLDSFSYIGGTATGAIIGTARVRDVYLASGTYGDANAQYYVYLYDIRMTTGDFKTARSIVSSTGICDIVLDTSSNAIVYNSNFDIAAFPISANSLRSLRDSNNAINNTYLFQQSFSVTLAGNGTFSLTTGASDEVFPYSTGLLSNLQTIDFKIILNAAATANLSGTITTASGNNVVIGVGTNFSTELRVQDKITVAGTTYRVGTITNTTRLTLTANASASKSANTYVKQYFSGDVLPMNVNGVSGSARTITIGSTTTAAFSLAENLNSTPAATVNCKLSKVNAHEKNKTLQVGCYVLIDTANNVASTVGPWSLGVPDIFRLNSVRTSGTTFTANTDGTDVTYAFAVDSGSRASYYDFGNIRNTSGVSLSRYVLVNFDYFVHDFSQGSGFFAINSYPIDDTIVTDPTKMQTSQLPIIQSPVDGNPLPLRNCIDFRPAKTATASYSNTISGATTNPPADSATMHVPSGGLHFPPVDGAMTASLSYYLPRKDLVSIQPTGLINITRGLPSEQPYTPQGPSNAMDIGSVTIPPYPSLATTAQTLWTANRVYTMHDVGALDKRIYALEYYSTLNLLEQNTSSLQILDSAGLTRFKNGFIVDPFTGSNVANVYDMEYKASIDAVNQECRPGFVLNHIGLTFDANNSSGVTKTGDLITLPYTSATFITQPYATTTRNAAGLEWNWKGTMTLIPDTDYWVDTTQNPDVTINPNGSNDNWNVPSGWQTQWNDWQTVWTGTPVVTNINTTRANTFNMTVAQYTALVTPYLANGGVIQSVTLGSVTNLNTAINLFNQWAGPESGYASNFYATYQNQSVTTTQNQVRTGTQTMTTFVNQQSNAGSFVTDSSLEPYMRSRAVVFYAQGMKPNSTLYPFFDSISVSRYCAPLTGFVIAANGSLDLSGTTYQLPTANLPSTSNTSTTVTPPSLGIPLITNSAGQIAGVFFLPSDATRRFTSGTKVFRLTDNITNADAVGEVTTAAEASYSAEGLSITKENLIVTTRVPVVTTQSISQTQTITTTSNTSVLIGVHSEPIVQGFQVVLPATEPAQGIFLTKLDLYFASKDPNLPVTVSLVQIDQTTQQVTASVVPLSEVTLYPSQVNVSSDATAITTFIFKSPIFLNRSVTYGFKIFPNGSNPNYTLWTATLGDSDITTGIRIIQQPATGTMFVSANDKTYSAIQDEQIKYTIYLAQFTTNATGTAKLFNTPNELLQLTGDSTSGFIVSGEPIFGQTDLTYSGGSGSFSPGQYVVGGTSTANGTIATVGGGVMSLTNVPITKKFVVGETVTGYYTNGVATSATASANAVSFAYGSQYAMNGLIMQLTDLNSAETFATSEQVIGQINGLSGTVAGFGTIQVDTHQPQISQLVFGNTSLTWAAMLTANTGSHDAGYSTVVVNDNNDLTSQHLIYGAHYETTTLSGHSYNLAGSLYSTSAYVSPVIDLTRCGLICIGNIINNILTNETTPHSGLAVAKYVTRVATLASNMDAEDLLVYLTNYRPPGSDVLVFAKLANFEDYQPVNDHNWVQLVPDGTTYSDATNKYDFKEYTYSLPSTSLTGPNGAYQYVGGNGVTFTGYRNYIIKVVFLSPNTALIPRMKNLRGIALQR